MLLVSETRIEVYALVEEGVDGYDAAMALLGALDSLAADVASHGYFAEGIDAVSHFLCAVAGTDGFAEDGEDLPGALGAARREARAVGCLPPLLEALVAAGDELAARLALLESQQSAAALGETVAELGRRVFDHLDRRQVLLVGASPLAQAAAEALAAAGLSRFSLIGEGDGEGVLAGLEIVAAEAEALPVVLGNADIVLATGANGTPVLDKRLVKGALRARRGRAMLLVDAAGSPGAAIDPAVASLDGAVLYNGDDLALLTREAPWSRLGRSSSCDAAVADAVRAFSYQLA